MSPVAPLQTDLLGRRLGGRYRVESVIARGGMSVVYRALDERLQRPVAVKVLSQPYAGDSAFVQRFLEEARIAASFSHPNVVHVYDFGTDGGAHYLVLELLEGFRSLRAELHEHGPLPAARAIAVMLDVLAGLEPLHARGIVHCDVKAGNVMIGAQGVKLIDFGIARVERQPSRSETSIGSLHAMSPEQLRGEALTPASDIFAAGVVLYEMLTGQVPFPGDTSDEVARAHRHGVARPPSALASGISERVDDVVMQALRDEPARRFASAAAMAVALNAARRAQRAADGEASGDTTTALPLPSRPAAAPRSRRALGLRLALLVAVAAPLLLLGVVLVGRQEPSGAAETTATPQATQNADPTLAPGMVRIPDTIGLSEKEAEAAARAAGLAWRIEWRVVPGKDPGVYDQEPPAGRVVPDGSRFVMYAYRDR